MNRTIEAIYRNGVLRPLQPLDLPEELRVILDIHIEYFWSMEVKTSITLSSSLITAIDEQAESFKNRSAFIEVAVRAFLAQRQHEARESSDLAIITERADRLNAEAAEVLEYQVIP